MRDRRSWSVPYLRRLRCPLEDVALGLHQFRRRVEPQLLRERRPVDRVDGQGIGRGAQSVQRAHQQQGRPVAQRLLGDERAQLVGRLPCTAQLEQHLRALLAGGDAGLLEAQSLALGDVVGQPCPGRAAPQCQGLVVRRQPTAVLEAAARANPAAKRSASRSTPVRSSR